MSWRRLSVALLLSAAMTAPLKQGFAMDRETAKQQGKALGNMAAGQARNAATSPNLSNVPGYSTSNPPQTGYNDDNMYDAGVAEAEVNEAAKLLTGSFATRPKYNINKSDPWLQHGWDVTTDPHAVADKFTGKYQDCAPLPGGQWPTPTEYRQCDVWKDFAEHSCTVGRVVEVDDGHGYACHVGKNVLNRTCDRYVVVTATPGGSGCVHGTTYASGSYNMPGWPSGYMRVSATFYCSNNQVVLGYTCSQSGWPGGCLASSRSYTYGLPGGGSQSYINWDYQAMQQTWHTVSCTAASGGYSCFVQVLGSPALSPRPVLINTTVFVGPPVTLSESETDECGPYY